MELQSLEARLPDGERILFRPIRPDDKAKLQQGMAMLSPESRYRRFFRHIDHLSDRQLAYLTEVDFTDHVAWMAELPDAPGVPGVGVGRWIRLAGEPDVAEAAVTVIDSYQHQGIGRTLLWLLARTAIERDVKAFRAWALGDNKPMLDLLQAMGAQPGRWEEGVLEMTVPLPTDPDALHETPAPLILRAVAQGQFETHAEPERPAAARLLPGDDPK
ncbi:MAG TPA: GNAT family N-acetyltransferase [Actinomycetota bacterium]|nr:GNAT family N-acetyltransferase [Actinomycetota bacterium]